MSALWHFTQVTQVQSPAWTNKFHISFSPFHPSVVTTPSSLKLAISEITSLSMAQKGES
jgi:hypothetical protein